MAGGHASVKMAGPGSGTSAVILKASGTQTISNATATAIDLGDVIYRYDGWAGAINTSGAGSGVVQVSVDGFYTVMLDVECGLEDASDQPVADAVEFSFELEHEGGRLAYGSRSPASANGDTTRWWVEGVASGVVPLLAGTAYEAEAYASFGGAGDHVRLAVVNFSIAYVCPLA